MAEAVDVAKIVLIPNERSIHFTKRECNASEPLKVGRSVDKKRILTNNLIFDCRVLSRNHALIWFENGKFFIKDTKSSNGTFVNETRLSSSGEESAPRELRSKDIVQFGVNVNVEKKAHGCIIARIRLFINDTELPGVEPPVQQVLQIIQSALLREQELETKLVSMQTAIDGARQLATESMIAIVREDELLSRLEMLENQLQVYAKNSSEDELKKQLAKAYEEKHQTDLTSKNSMRNILQEKLEYVSKVNQLQRDYDKAEEECQRYRTLYDAIKQEHTQDVAKFSDQVKQAEEERKTLQEKLTEEKESLTANMETLRVEVEFTKEQLVKAKQRLEETEDELVKLKITQETDKQRKAAAAVQNSPLSDSIKPLEQAEITEQLVNDFVQLEALPPTQPNTTSEGGDPSEGDSPLLAPNLERRFTLMSPDNALLFQQIETRQKEWEGRVKGLEEELEESEKTVRNLQMQLAGYVKQKAVYKQVNVRDLARRMSDRAIAKGQIEVLHASLEEAQEKIQSLQNELTSESSAKCALQRALQAKLQTEAKDEEMASITAEARQGSVRGNSVGTDDSMLKEEVTRLREKYTKQLKEAVRVKTENTDLVREIEGLRQQLDRSEMRVKDTEGPLQKRVQILTIIALVSIGVALASWLT